MTNPAVNWQTAKTWLIRYYLFLLEHSRQFFFVEINISEIKVNFVVIRDQVDWKEMRHDVIIHNFQKKLEFSDLIK